VRPSWAISSRHKFSHAYASNSELRDNVPELNGGIRKRQFAEFHEPRRTETIKKARALSDGLGCVIAAETTGDGASAVGKVKLV